MTEPGAPPPDPMGEFAALAQDWVTLWQSELAATAMDREAQESWQSALALWAGAAQAALRPLERGHERGAGPAAAPRPAPAAAAPDARDAEIERLARRVAELEQRLAELERRRGGDAAAGGVPRP